MIPRGATLSTLGLYHYPATITNSNTTAAFATFGTTTGFSSTLVAGVINTFSGRQQVSVPVYLRKGGMLTS